MAPPAEGTSSCFSARSRFPGVLTAPTVTTRPGGRQRPDPSAIPGGWPGEEGARPAHVGGVGRTALLDVLLEERDPRDPDEQEGHEGRPDEAPGRPGGRADEAD